MAMPSKRRPPPPAKRPTRASRRASERSSAPFLRFYHSEELRQTTLAVLASVEEAPDATAHPDALADLVVELTKSGLDYYFMRPLALAKPSFIVRQSANLGMAGAQQVMGSVIRSIISRMDRPQLLSVCGSIRHLMV